MINTIMNCQCCGIDLEYIKHTWHGKMGIYCSKDCWMSVEGFVLRP